MLVFNKKNLNVQTAIRLSLDYRQIKDRKAMPINIGIFDRLESRIYTPFIMDKLIANGQTFTDTQQKKEVPIWTPLLHYLLINYY